MQLLSATDRPPELIEALFAVWEDAVRATHFFLTEKDIVALRPWIRPALCHVPSLVYATDADGSPCAFMGVDNHHIEMLFVSSRYRGQGLGRCCIIHAVNTLNASFVDVNEDNPQALGFYQHLGFTVCGRSAHDGQGNPFPLLHLQRTPGAPLCPADAASCHSALPSAQ